MSDTTLPEAPEGAEWVPNRRKDADGEIVEVGPPELRSIATGQPVRMPPVAAPLPANVIQSPDGLARHVGGKKNGEPYFEQDQRPYLVRQAEARARQEQAERDEAAKRNAGMGPGEFRDMTGLPRDRQGKPRRDIIGRRGTDGLPRLLMSYQNGC